MSKSIHNVVPTEDDERRAGENIFGRMSKNISTNYVKVKKR
jgi:hypothetical protein